MTTLSLSVLQTGLSTSTMPCCDVYHAGCSWTCRGRRREKVCVRVCNSNGILTAFLAYIEILKILLRDEQLALDVDLKLLAKKTETFSGSDLRSE